ncbi:protein kinase domain-containing protein [Planctomycetes bacterium TBK1r]|uniref:Serine/threonine-protein kinase PrkC n=1 Tax=Stieleria magnilauensis TaxID=2527963 RepID=A0ABX5XK09_9BACT|nr:Serine/threonine-protein kinase PrkC [Planctomycetes bacterium TBK1r]
MEPDSIHEKESEFVESINDRPDGWLLREWKYGDERAAEVLFDRYAMRLVALVASRLNRRYRSEIDPSEVVQSAMGSFFDAAKHSRIQVSGCVSLWRLLASFARRKMARSIEKVSAAKRGGGQTRVSLDDVPPQPSTDRIPTAEEEANAFLAILRSELPQELLVVVEGVLADQTQREIADAYGIDERTVRRRLSRIRERLSHEHMGVVPTQHTATGPPKLPRVGYHEFVLGKLIGSGGFGKVYRARLQSDDRTVAVKFLRKAFWQNEDARQTFLREINLASQIDHPGVIRYLGYGESPPGGPYIISEWIDGKSLQQVDGVNTSRFIGWLKQICAALQAVHRAELVHGDLTPSNILCDAEDRITITDFGFSQASTKSVLPILGGTLGFAAPEQIAPAFGSISTKTDIYAIGGLLHWFLFGRPPNAGHGIEGVLSQTLSDQEFDASAIQRVSPVFRDILIATLRKSPVNRSMGLTEILRMLDDTDGSS